MNLYEKLVPIAGKKNKINVGKCCKRYLRKIKRGLTFKSYCGSLSLSIDIPDNFELFYYLRSELKKEGFKIETEGRDSRGNVEAVIRPLDVVVTEDTLIMERKYD